MVCKCIVCFLHLFMNIDFTLRTEVLYLFDNLCGLCDPLQRKIEGEKGGGSHLESSFIQYTSTHSCTNIIAMHEKCIFLCTKSAHIVNQ